MSAYYLIKIPVEGDPVLIPSAQRPSLDALHRHVGGYIETVPTKLYPGNVVMLLDDEGKIKDKSYNRMATICGRLGRGDFVAGDAILVLRDGCDLKAIPRGLALKLLGRKEDRR